jgi:hypothetical protein
MDMILHGIIGVRGIGIVVGAEVDIVQDGQVVVVTVVVVTVVVVTVVTVVTVVVVMVVVVMVMVVTIKYNKNSKNNTYYKKLTNYWLIIG